MQLDENYGERAKRLGELGECALWTITFLIPYGHLSHDGYSFQTLPASRRGH